MVEFEKIDGKKFEFGDKEFIEVTKKIASSEEGEEPFISIVRGFLDEDGNKRYKNNISVPLKKDVVNFLKEALPEMVE